MVGRGGGGSHYSKRFHQYSGGPHLSRVQRKTISTTSAFFVDWSVVCANGWGGNHAEHEFMNFFCTADFEPLLLLCLETPEYISLFHTADASEEKTKTTI